MLDTIIQFESSILLWIQEVIRQPVLTPIIKFITSLGNHGLIWIAITVCLLLFKKTRKVGVMSAIALMGSLIVNNMILKNLVARIRPYEVIDGLERIIEKQKDLSFPSGHSGSSLAAGVVLFRNLPKRFGIPALILAILIALSRLYVGVHYPTDVLVGILDGILLAILSEFLVNQYMKRREKMKQ